MATSTASAESSTFLWLSDLHYDPYFGQAQASNRHNSSLCSDSSTPQYGCDSPFSLISSAIESASSHQKAEFAILTGDFCRHQMEALAEPTTKELPEILQTIFSTMREERHFGKLPILPVLGNDDAIPDYFLDLTDSSTASLLQIMADVFLENDILAFDESKSFAKGGYYRRHFGNLTFLCLNTVIYSLLHQPEIPSFNTDPLDQFTWLEAELQHCLSDNHSVYIIGHIPPTIGSFQQMDMWHNSYLAIYNDIVRKYRSIIKAQLFGHFHTDEFRQTKDSPLLIIGSSVTPVYQNNPSYRLVHYDKATGDPQDMDSYSLNISNPDDQNWTKVYSLRETYGLGDMSSIANLLTSLRKHDERILRNFLFNLKGGIWKPKTLECMENPVKCSAGWVCIITSNTRDDFLDCAGGGRPASSANTRNTVWFSVMAILAILAICAGGNWWRLLRRRRSQYNTPVEDDENRVSANNDDHQHPLDFCPDEKEIL